MLIKLDDKIGSTMYVWAKDLFPICRSITGDGVRKTLKYLQEINPEINIHEVTSGTKAFDWVVPDEWNIHNAYVEDEKGKRIIDFKKNNLHVIGYSKPVNKVVSLDELQRHLYSLPQQLDAIPYVTSYYQKRWGFCLTEKQRKLLRPGKYHAVIDGTLKQGYLTYGELILPGKDKKEIFLSTYICHPSMANNELSGPVVTTALINYLKVLPDRRYTYRIIFIPETIGSIVYLAKNLKQMKERIIAGFVVTCVGDNRAYSYLSSRLGNTLADVVAKHVLKYHAPEYIAYSFLDRGSDERQYCSVNVDLPVCSIMRTKYGMYPEYHTSLDNLDFISPDGLYGAYRALVKCITLLEENYCWKNTCCCEPQLGKRGLYPTLSTKYLDREIKVMMNILAYADGERDLLQLAEKIGENALDCLPIILRLEQHGLLKKHVALGKQK